MVLVAPVRWVAVTITCSASGSLCPPFCGGLLPVSLDMYMIITCQLAVSYLQCPCHLFASVSGSETKRTPWKTWPLGAHCGVPESPWNLLSFHLGLTSTAQNGRSSCDVIMAHFRVFSRSPPCPYSEFAYTDILPCSYRTL